MKPKKNKTSIFVDLDGTLIWTWRPLITSAFMSAVLGEPISTPPKPKDGYRKLVRVPIGDEYALSCCRPSVRPLLSDLRDLAEVCMLTHSSSDYALAMNRTFKLGFSEMEIFPMARVRHGVGLPLGNYLLIDDEAWSHCLSDAWSRHCEKCQVLNLEIDSSRVIAVPPFAGMRVDSFTRSFFRRSIWYRAKIALNLQPGDRQRADVYSKVLVRAEAVLGSEGAAHDWIATPQPALGFRTPISKLEHKAGVSAVMAALSALGEDRNKMRVGSGPTNHIKGPSR